VTALVKQDTNLSCAIFTVEVEELNRKLLEMGGLVESAISRTSDPGRSESGTRGASHP
jgi:hypothetical protein